MLTFIVFFPVIGAVVLATLPREQERHAKWMALAVTGAVLGFTLAVFAMFDRGSDEAMQFTERFRWIRAEDAGFDIQYFLGVDGLGLTMVVLTGLLFVVAVLVSWNVELRAKEYFAWLLALETGVMGVFTAQDLIFFFLFWEVELIPMYLLISIWGSGRKSYSAMKFVLFTLFGSALMLVGFLVLAFSADPSTFDMVALRDSNISDALLPLPAIFVLIFAAFAIKLPIVPLHTWLPDAHTDAPTAVSVILAGVLLKMGGYGMLRLVSIMPDTAQDFAVWMASFAAGSIIYGAIVTMRQTDLKRLIAYSSVSHMGYVLLGIAALGQVGMTGAALQMFSHGLITGLLFVIVGMIYDRAHTRDIRELSGLAHVTPVIATAMLMAGLASLGLPAMSGFVAEVTVFLGAGDRFAAPTVLGVIGVLLSAGYILWTIQRTMFGPRNERWADLPDATAWWEQVPVAAMLAIILAVGIYPARLVDVIEQGILPIATRLG
ncbi:MAG: NADH-quinone oxidoreductase subunit M [Dehalococcoidia bacterium]